MEEPIRIIVAAADPLIRTGLVAILDRLDSADVVAQTDLYGLADPNTLPGTGAADVVVWDVGWDDSPDEAFDPAAVYLPIVSLVGDAEQAEYALSAGCQAVLLRHADEESILAAAEAVLAGLTVLSPELVDFLIPPIPEYDTLVDDLTPREAEVLDLVAEGLTNKAIALTLSISEHTVKFHVNAILTKLGAQSRTEAVVTATRLGLISL